MPEPDVHQLALEYRAVGHRTQLPGHMSQRGDQRSGGHGPGSEVVQNKLSRSEIKEILVSTIHGRVTMTQGQDEGKASQAPGHNVRGAHSHGLQNSLDILYK